MSGTERLVQRILSSTGEPAVSFSKMVSTVGTNSGCATLAFFRPPFFSNVIGSSVIWQLIKILLPVANGIRVAAQKVGHVLHATMSEFLSLHGGVSPPIFLRERAIQSSHVTRDVRRIKLHRSILRAKVLLLRLQH